LLAQNDIIFSGLHYAAGVQSGYSNEVSKTVSTQQATPVTYSITATSSGNGVITALNNNNVSTATSGSTTISSVKVNSGANQSISITPATGYKIAGVTVDGASVGAVTSYTFSNVTANHTLGDLRGK